MVLNAVFVASGADKVFGKGESAEKCAKDPFKATAPIYRRIIPNGQENLR